MAARTARVDRCCGLAGEARAVAGELGAMGEVIGPIVLLARARRQLLGGEPHLWQEQPDSPESAQPLASSERRVSMGNRD